MLRTLFFSAVFGVITLYYFLHLSSSPTLNTKMSTASWESSFSGWHARALATPHPNPHSFSPTRETLLLAVLLNAPAEHEGITLTLFSETPSDDSASSNTVAVDALGRVSLVPAKDAEGLLALAHNTLELPQTDAFRNTWVVKQPATSQPIHRLFTSKSDSFADPHEVSVQGFSKEKKELKTPVQGITELPDVLWELFGLVLEAREDAGNGEDDRRDQTVLGKVRAAVGDLF